MERTVTLGLGLLAGTLLALTGCGDDRSPLAPETGASNENALRGLATGTGVVTVVHGVPGLTVDVYVNGANTLPSFEPGTVTDPLELPEGDYDIVIVPEGGDFPDDGVISGSAFLPAGANVSMVAYLAEDGTPSFKTFVNDLSPTRFIRSRVVVRHVAEAPTVDVRLFRKFLPWWPVRTIRDLSNPDEAQTDLFPGWLQAKIYPAGSSTPVFETGNLPFYPNKSQIVYAVGSLSGGTFGLLVQNIDLPRSGGWWRDANGVEIDDTLTLDEYDAIAAEQGIDRQVEAIQ